MSLSASNVPLAMTLTQLVPHWGGLLSGCSLPVGDNEDLHRCRNRVEPTFAKGWHSDGGILNSPHRLSHDVVRLIAFSDDAVGHGRRRRIDDQQQVRRTDVRNAKTRIRHDSLPAHAA